MADHATQPHPDDQPVPVVDCALYKHGKRRAGTLPLTEAMDTARTSPDSFVWIGLREPTTDQLEVVADAFGLHPLAVEDAVHAHQRPKLERYDDSLFLVLKTVVYVEHDHLTPTSEVVSTGEIMIFAGRDFAVVVRHGDSPDLRVVRRQLETQPELLAHGPAAAVHAIADTVVDQYLDVVRAIETDVEQVEAGVFSGTHRRLGAYLPAQAGGAGAAARGGAARDAAAGAGRGARRASTPRSAPICGT